MMVKLCDKVRPVTPWIGPTLGRVAADGIMDATYRGDSRASVSVGFGGTHYPGKFTRICLEGDY